MDVPAEALRVTTERVGEVARLAIDGEVDIATAPVLAAAFEEVLDTGPERIEIDCTDLRFLDSSGIQVLVGAWDRMRDRAGMPVVLQHVSPLVQQVLAACGIKDLLME